MSKENLKQNVGYVGAGPVSAQKNNNGITLVAMVITIILMLILAGVTVTTSLKGGLFGQAKIATDEYTNLQNIEQIEKAYLIVKDSPNLRNKTNREMFEAIKNNLNFENATYGISSQAMSITTKEGNNYTLLIDGKVIEGKFAYLDISDGSIDIKETGYIQGPLEKKGSSYNVTGELVEYTGEYIITGTSSENAVRITEPGTYNITIKNLNIDVSTFDNLCAFNANENLNKDVDGYGYKTGVYVNLKIEGNNSLYGGAGAACLGFVGATPNINGVTNGSTLTIGGNGKLYCKAASYGTGIGGGYTGRYGAEGNANNIIINSGYIETRGGANCSGIGGAWGKNCSNLIINGGEIYAYGSIYGAGIGAPGTASNIIINGGKINASSGIGYAIGGSIIENLQINGGEIYASQTSKATNSKYLGCIGGDGNLEINGGTIHGSKINSAIYGIYSGTGNIKITGGSTKIDSTEDYIVSSTPINGESNLYLTAVQLENVTDKTEITSLTTSDNINYGIKDMYTSQDDRSTTSENEGGILYLYLPLGSRTITVEAGNTTYSGTVETSEINALVVLNRT